MYPSFLNRLYHKISSLSTRVLLAHKTGEGQLYLTYFTNPILQIDKERLEILPYISFQGIGYLLMPLRLLCRQFSQ